MNNTFHPNLSDTMVLKRVEIAVQKGGELEFDLVKLERTFIVLITESHDTFQIHETKQGVKFCIFEKTTIKNKQKIPVLQKLKKIPEL